jgi:hypothetical protein
MRQKRQEEGEGEEKKLRDVRMGWMSRLGEDVEGRNIADEREQSLDTTGCGE